MTEKRFCSMKFDFSLRLLPSGESTRNFITFKGYIVFFDYLLIIFADFRYSYVCVGRIDVCFGGIDEMTEKLLFVEIRFFLEFVALRGVNSKFHYF